MIEKVKPSDLGLLMTIGLLVAIDLLHSGLLAFAAEPIMGEIGASQEEYSLSIAAYACMVIVSISRLRWFVERFGWRNFIVSSLGISVIGALICGFSHHLATFYLGRIIMGLGGAAFMTSARTMVNLFDTGAKRFSAIKYYSSGLTLGIALAPVTAAWAVTEHNASLIFFILVGLTIMAAVLAFFNLPVQLVDRELQSQTHPVLFMLLASACFALLYVIQRAQYDFFSNLTWLVIITSVAVMALYYYFRRLWRHTNPVINLVSLKNKKYILGVSLFTLCYVMLGANGYMLPTLIQTALGFAWNITGSILSLGLFSALLTWFVMSWIIPRWRNVKKFFVAGFFALAVMGWQLSQLTPDVNVWFTVVPAIFAYGVFITFVLISTSIQTFSEVQHNETVFSHAQQLKNMLAQFGMAFGIAIATLAKQWRTSEHYNVLHDRIVNDDPFYSQILQTLIAQFTPSLGETHGYYAALAQTEKLVFQQATLLATADYFMAICIIGVVGTLVMGYQRLMK